MILWLALAWAGDGPWTLRPGETSLYLGLQETRFTRVDTEGGPFDIDGGVVAVGAVGVATLGLAEGWEVEGVVPWLRARHQDPRSLVCNRPARPTDFCDTTQGLGTLGLSVKARLLDEAALRPVSLALRLSASSSEASSAARGRLTAIGDGQTDLGLAVTIGRTASAMQAGWYNAQLTAGYAYRLPLATEPVKVPADQLVADLSVIVSPHRVVALGPAFSAFHRLGGTDLDRDLDLSDPNGFASLQASQLKAGGKVSLFGAGGVTVSASFFGTLAAVNNPTDTTSLSVGVGWFRKPPEPAG